jgi:hypothetical protein
VIVIAGLLAACGDNESSGQRAEQTNVAIPAGITTTPRVQEEILEEPSGTAVADETTAAPNASVRTAAELCARAVEGEAGRVSSPDLIEISGMAASRTQDVIWAHNDSGDTARVFGMRPDGEHLATYTLDGAEAIDWEDMALGPGPEEGVGYLYLGDIGDNASARAEIVVYRAVEPEFGPASSDLSLDAEALVLRYPDGAHDAETLLSDPRTGDLYIVTKDITGGPSGVYRAPPGLGGGSETTLEKVGDIEFAALTPGKEIPPEAGPLPSGLGRVPTGGDISPDGSILAIRTYGTAWLWPRTEGATVAEAFGASPCEGPSALEPQGEAIAFAADGAGYFTASEGVNPPLSRFHAE